MPPGLDLLQRGATGGGCRGGVFRCVTDFSLHLKGRRNFWRHLLPIFLTVASGDPRFRRLDVAGDLSIDRSPVPLNRSLHLNSRTVPHLPPVAPIVPPAVPGIVMRESSMPPKILVADDSSTIRTLVRRALTRAGLDVTVACDGREAVETARRERPDLVILDIQMPEMDGYTACEQILALEDRVADLPIIFLTRDTASHLSMLGNQLGAYLHKPVCDETLVTTVRTLLRRSGEAARCVEVHS